MESKHLTGHHRAASAASASAAANSRPLQSSSTSTLSPPCPHFIRSERSWRAACCFASFANVEMPDEYSRARVPGSPPEPSEAPECGQSPGQGKHGGTATLWRRRLIPVVLVLLPFVFAIQTGRIGLDFGNPLGRASSVSSGRADVENGSSVTRSLQLSHVALLVHLLGTRRSFESSATTSALN